MARLRQELGAGRSDEAEPVSRLGARSGAPHPEGRAAERRHAVAGSRAAGHGAGRLGRPCEADVRSAGARAAGRHDAGHHVPAGARNQHANLSADRRARAAPSRLAPYERSGEAREAGQDQRAITCRCSRTCVEKLQATPDGDGSLLDHSMYLLGSGMGNPDIHNHTNLPIVLAGGRTSKMKGARHIKYEQPTPLANLHLTLLDKVGVHLDSFADSSGKIAIWSLCSEPRSSVLRSWTIDRGPPGWRCCSWPASRRGQRPPKCALVDAVKAADSAAVRALLDQRVDVECRRRPTAPRRCTGPSISDALRRLVELLVRAGANVNAANRYGVTPLWLACVNGNAAVIEMLLKAGADANTVDAGGRDGADDGRSHRQGRGGEGAARSRRGGECEGRLARTDRADVGRRRRSSRCRSMLWSPAAPTSTRVRTADSRRCCLRRAKAGSRRFKPLVDGRREPERCAAGRGDASVSDRRCRSRCPRQAPEVGLNAFLLAAANAHYELAAWFLDRGADPNAAPQGWTALHQVSWVRKAGVSGSNNPAPEGSGNMDSLEFVRKLVAKGAALNARVTKKPPHGRHDTQLDRRNAVPARSPNRRRRPHAPARRARCRSAAAQRRRDDPIDGGGRRRHSGAGRRSRNRAGSARSRQGRARSRQRLERGRYERRDRHARRRVQARAARSCGSWPRRAPGSTSGISPTRRAGRP